MLVSPLTYSCFVFIAVVQRTVDLVSLVNNWQVGSVYILQILSGENHLKDVILRGTGKLYRKIVVPGNMLITC